MKYTFYYRNIGITFKNVKVHKMHQNLHLGGNYFIQNLKGKYDKLYKFIAKDKKEKLFSI